MLEQVDRLAMLELLRTPSIYSIFAFIEICTCIYVWGELLFPSTFCGHVRPLSLYYYPVLMSLLDLVKLNIYISYQYFRRDLYTNSCLVLFNMEVFVSNCWVTTALAGMFVWSACCSIMIWCSSIFSSSSSSSNSSSSDMYYKDTLPVVILNPITDRHRGTNNGINNSTTVDVDVELSSMSYNKQNKTDIDN